MSKTYHKYKAKFNEQTKDYYHLKKGKDGSIYAIPKYTDKGKGARFSFHPSMIFNYRSKDRDFYNILSKLTEIKSHVKDVIENAVKIQFLRYYLIRKL